MTSLDLAQAALAATRTAEANLVQLVAALTPAPAPAPAPTPPPSAALPKYGISSGSRIIDRRSPADQDFELDQSKAVGSLVQRIDCWRQSEALTDVVVTKIIARKMEPLIVLGGTERDWTPARLAGYAGWWTAQAKRWLGKARLYEIFNEPDLNGGTPELYTAVLKQAYGEIKAAAPNALVIAGALWKWDRGVTANPAGGAREWVRRMYAAGAKGHFDVLSLHLYDDPLEHGAWNLWDQAFSMTPSVRSIMDANGGRAVPIISTESGGPTPKYPLDRQASIVRNALVDPRLPMCLIYTMLDDDVPGFGLLDPNRKQRPSWAAYKAAVS